MNLQAYLSSFASGGGNQSPLAMLKSLLALDSQEFQALDAEFNTHFKAAHKKYIEADVAAKEKLRSEFSALSLPKKVLKVARQTRELAPHVMTLN